MKKTSLYIEPTLDRALARRAADQGMSKAEYVRRALAEAVETKRRRTPRGRGSFSGPEDLDRHLAESGFGER